MSDPCPFQRSSSFRCLPRQGPRFRLEPRRPADCCCQPALESFEQPLLHFWNRLNRPRRSPVLPHPVLQRPIHVEVALISRVFRSSDRNLLTDCISFSAAAELGSCLVEIVSYARLRRLSNASEHCCPKLSPTLRWKTDNVKRGFVSGGARAHRRSGPVFSLWNRRPSWGL